MVAQGQRAALGKSNLRVDPSPPPQVFGSVKQRSQGGGEGKGSGG